MNNIKLPTTFPPKSPQLLQSWIAPSALCLLMACVGPSAAGAGSGVDATAGDGAVIGRSDSAAAKGPPKLDLLMVVDHSSSMCQEQRLLAKAFGAFADKLGVGKGGLDLQVAVVSVQQLPDAKVITNIGAFAHTPATTLPHSCIERSKQPCMADAHCDQPACFAFANADAHASMCPQGGEKCSTAKPLPAGDWFCKFSPPEGAATVNNFNNNDNCSVNTSCQLRCKTDKDCYAVFEPDVPEGQHQVHCNTVVSPGGCMFPPPTAGCPTAEKLPAVLKSSVAAQVAQPDGTTKAGTTVDWLRCNATLGANQEPEALFEGGLRSAWLALDPKGPNCQVDAEGKPKGTCQYADLVRPDACLAIVVFSDDDDCSLSFEYADKLGELPPGSTAIGKEIQRSCQGFNDRLGDNKGLIAGACALDQFKSPAKPPKACPQDCPALGAPGTGAYDACVTEAQAHIAALKTTMSKEIFQDDRFAAAADFLDRFKSLKADPNKVLFAAITGDIIAPPAAAPAWTPDKDVASYYRALLRNTAGVQTVYACTGATGEAGYGAKYLRLAQLFGDNGYVASLCAAGDLGAAMEGLAGKLKLKVN